MSGSRDGRFLAILIGVAVLGPLGIQLLLPALPAVQAGFGVPAGTAQLVLSVSMLALAVSTLVYGPLSDRKGRRPVLLTALTLFLVGSVICIVAPRLWVLLVGRIVQAVGGASGMVVSRAVARDRYGPEQSTRIIGYLFIAIVIAPLPAPAIGGLLTDVFGWRANFVATGVLGLGVFAAVALGLAETLRLSPTPSAAARPLAAYGRLLRSRAFLGYASQSAFAMGAFFAFISATPYVVVTILGRPAREYGVWVLVVSFGMVLGSAASARIAGGLGRDRAILLGCALALLGAAAGIALSLRGHWTPLTIFVPGVVLALGCGLSLPASVTGAIDVEPEAAGSAAGLSGFFQLLASAVFAQAASTWQDGAPLPMSVVVSIATLFALVTFVPLSSPGRRS